MKRRAFIAALGGAAVWPVVARGQKQPVRLGFLSSGDGNSPVSQFIVAYIKQGLRDNGLTEGRDYIFDARFAAGEYERFPELARELAQAGVSIILTNTIASVRAAQKLTPPLPIVMVPINDPVGSGLIANLARPGGLTTGVATLYEDLTLKLLEYLRSVLPKARTIAALYNPRNPSNLKFLDDLRVHAGEMAMTITPVELRSPKELNVAFAAIAAQRPDTLQVLADSGTLDMSDRIAAFALAQRLPSFSTVVTYAEFGGLLAYGPPIGKLLAKSGYYVKRISGRRQSRRSAGRATHDVRAGDQPQDHEGAWYRNSGSGPAVR